MKRSIGLFVWAIIVGVGGAVFGHRADDLSGPWLLFLGALLLVALFGPIAMVTYAGRRVAANNARLQKELDRLEQERDDTHTS